MLCCIFFTSVLLRNWPCNLSHLYGIQTCFSECLEIRKTSWVLHTLFKYAKRISEKKRLLAPSCSSVRLSLSARNISAPHWKDFYKFWYLRNFRETRLTLSVPACFNFFSEASNVIKLWFPNNLFNPVEMQPLAISAMSIFQACT